MPYDDEYQSNDPRVRRAVASVAARMKQHDERQEHEEAEQRAIDARRREREQDAAARCPYDWSESDIIGADALSAERSVADLEEQHTEDRQLDAGDDADEDRDQSRDPTRRAVDSVKKLMKKKRLLGDEGYEQEILDSLPGDEEEIPGQQSKALEKAKRANAEAKADEADEPDAELREMIASQGLDEDEDDEE